jgi:IS5 family transposase
MVVKADKVRADTTAVEANVAYPTDSGLMAKGLARMAGMVKACAGGRTPSGRDCGAGPTTPRTR